MTARDLNHEWARSEIEAWVDGSLTGERRARMAAALAADPALREAAERAAAVRRALRAPGVAPLPVGLRGRLLAIPGRSAPAWRRSWTMPAAAGAVAAIAAVAIVLSLRPTAPPPPDPRVVAVQEFELAMRYLQKSARITQSGVTNAVGAGLRDAFAASRAALDRDTDETGG